MIISKRMGVNTLPSYGSIVDSFQYNPDGVGVAWSDGETLWMMKGFFRLGEFIKWWEKSPIVGEPEKYSFSIHFRLATHWGTSASHLHPFPLDYGSDILATEGEYEEVFFHNGVLSPRLYSNAPWDTRQLSDTMSFVEQTARVYGLEGFREENEVMGMTIAHNKFVVMNNKGDIEIVNEDLGVWNNGIWFSNKYLSF